MSAAERIAVMEGELEGIDLVEILQVVGIGRQYTGVELRKADQTPLGTLFIKAGKVVSAVAGQARGREAFFQLFQLVGSESRKFFHVFRMETPKELPEPIGSLGNLLLDALARSKEGTAPQKTASGVIPRPMAVSGDTNGSATATAEANPAPASAPRSSASTSSASNSAVSTSSASNSAAVAAARRRPTAVPSTRSGSGTSSSTLTAATPPSTATAQASDTASPQGASSTTVSAADKLLGPISTRTPANETVTIEASGPRSGTAARKTSDTADTVTPRVSGSGIGGGPVVLGVVSPKGGSGKTTIALNLALSFARQDRSVILVDADINGDVLSAIAARSRARHGVMDVLLGRVGHEAALLRTVLPHFRILPAVGEHLPEPAEIDQDHSRAWEKLLAQLSGEADIVLVDGPAGMFGPTRQFLTSCTHALGVLQAELIASRSFDMFARALEAMPAPGRPQVVGIVLNMLRSRHGASVRVLSDACAALPKGWLLDTAIPRSDAFLEATEEGLPLRMLDDKNPPAVSWLFDTLATELSERLGLDAAQRKPKQLLI